MSDIQKLLEVQTLDIEGDTLRARRLGLPERAKREACDARLQTCDQARAEIQLRADELAKSGRALDGEVASITAKTSESEVRLYSGKVTASKELESLSEEIRQLKEKQSELEDRELEVLEAIDGVEAELVANAAQRAEIEKDAASLDAAIAEAEAEIDAELTKLGTARAVPAATIPQAILDAYDHLRGNARLAGRAAAKFEKKGCSGCRMDLPVMDASRVHSEPWDALVTCVHCKRVLVR